MTRSECRPLYNTAVHRCAVSCPCVMPLFTSTCRKAEIEVEEVCASPLLFLTVVGRALVPCLISEEMATVVSEAAKLRAKAIGED